MLALSYVSKRLASLAAHAEEPVFSLLDDLCRASGWQITLTLVMWHFLPPLLVQDHSPINAQVSPHLGMHASSVTSLGCHSP